MEKTEKGDSMGNYITERQRYEIELLLKEKYTIPRISDVLGIKYNTLYKEIARGTVEQMDSLLAVHEVYKADYAQMVYEKSTSNRGRNLKIGSDHRLAAYIETMIREKKYSPEALIRQIRNEGLHFDTTLCPKTIYNYLDMGLFLHVDNSDLPYKKPGRKTKKEEKSKVSLNNRKGRSIEERPKNVLDREEYGHWEMDTVVSAQGTGLSCLLVLSERMTREEIIMKIMNKRSCTVVRALNRLEKQYGSKAFREKFRTITCDNGVEFLDAKGIEKSVFTKQKRTTVYYCHPYSSYERGTNENINRMIRRFFPKGTNFDEIKPAQVAAVESWINNYPRGILNGLSSNLFRKHLGLLTA